MLYSKLNISKNANSKDIKNSYNNLVLKYHPDKIQHLPKNIQDNYYKILKEIKEAYKILSNSYEKQIYDNLSMDNDYKYNIEEFRQYVEKFSAFFIFATHLHKLYKYRCEFLPKLNERNNQKNEETNYQEDTKIISENKCQNNIEIYIQINLFEIYKSRTKNLNVVIELLNGKHKVETLFISLHTFQQLYVFNGLGNEYLDDNKNILRGDIYVNIVVEKDDFYEIFDVFQPYDLSCKVLITLPQYLYGLDIDLDVFGQLLPIKYEGGNPQMIQIHDLGLPFFDEEENKNKRGCLYIFFDLQLPSDLSFLKYEDNTNEDLEKFKNYIFKYFSFL